jgi:diacylglycerol kinase family enzyme
VNAVAAALRGSSVRVGIIPMGSGNGLAFAARIPRSPSRALEIIFAGQASHIDAFTINGQFSCMLCGIGFDARVAHEFARQPKRGLQTYIKVSLANFLSSGFYAFDIDLPGQDAASGFRTEAFFISIANANQFGNNVTIAPRASLSDGLLDIVIVKKRNKLRMLFSVIGQVLGGFSLQPVPARSSTRGILYFQAPALNIGNSQGAPLHIDGDPKDTAPRFEIRILPKVFQLIQP